MKFANANADLECNAFVDANAVKTSGGQARLSCIVTLIAKPSTFLGASARLRTISRIIVGKTTIIKIRRGGGSIPANACVKSGGNTPKTGGSAHIPKTGGSAHIPKTGGSTHIPKTGGSTHIPKVNSAKPTVLRINNGRKC
jgi:hypothetical protein